MHLELKDYGQELTFLNPIGTTIITGTPISRPRDRNVNYDPELYPEKWKKYVDFTHNQIMELMTDYGEVDILWLDGGWVAKESKENMSNWYIKKAMDTKSGFLKSTIVNQDIRMDELVLKSPAKNNPA